MFEDVCLIKHLFPHFDDENGLLGVYSIVHAGQSVLNVTCVKWEHLINMEVTIT